MTSVAVMIVPPVAIMIADASLGEHAGQMTIHDNTAVDCR